MVISLGCERPEPRPGLMNNHFQLIYIACIRGRTTAPEWFCPCLPSGNSRSVLPEQESSGKDASAEYHGTDTPWTMPLEPSAPWPPRHTVETEAEAPGGETVVKEELPQFSDDVRLGVLDHVQGVAQVQRNYEPPVGASAGAEGHR